MIRTFRVKHPGRVVVLPSHLAPGGSNLRLAQGESFDLDAARVDRFIRRSLENGDLEEITSEKGHTS